MAAQLRALPLLVLLLGATGLLCWLPAAHALALRDLGVARHFFYSGAFLLILTVILALAFAGRVPRGGARSHLAMLVGAYLLLPPAMAIPFLQAVPDTTVANAWFEMLSAFTTTGATAYDPARLPPSVHLWRATMSWFGGFFILLSAYAVLAPLNLGGAEVISGRVPGRGATGTTQITRIADPAERLPRYAMVIFPVYSGLTLVLWIGLLAAGEKGLVALTHAMGTMSTSGVSSQQGTALAGAGIGGEFLILCFLVFALTRRAMPFTGLAGLAGRSKALRNDPELRLAAVLILLVPLVLLLRHWLAEMPDDALSTFSGAAAAFWGALFTAASFLTTTGYESAYWNSASLWSGLEAPGMILLGLAMVGGGVATTAGGVTLLRVYALFRHGQREVERIVHPSSVGGEGAAGRRLRHEGAYMAWVFFMLFAMSIAVTILALSMAGVEFQPALVLAISTLTTTGPLAEVALAEPLAYGPLSTGVKVLLGIAMMLGRLETLAMIALFAPGGWRR